MNSLYSAYIIIAICFVATYFLLTNKGKKIIEREKFFKNKIFDIKAQNELKKLKKEEQANNLNKSIVLLVGVVVFIMLANLDNSTVFLICAIILATVVILKLALDIGRITKKNG